MGLAAMIALGWVAKWLLVVLGQEAAPLHIFSTHYV